MDENKVSSAVEGSMAKVPLKSTTISAKITRADGTVEDLGVISYWHKNPIFRYWFAIKQAFKRLIKKTRFT